MELEEAVKLKKGTILVANGTWLAPAGCTEGREYIMQSDSIISAYIKNSDFFDNDLHYRDLKESYEVRSVDLPIICDNGTLARATYSFFDIINAISHP